MRGEIIYPPSLHLAQYCESAISSVRIDVSGSGLPLVRPAVTVHYSTVQYITAALQYSTVQYNAVQRQYR